MTAQETLNTVRLLLDSGHEWYASIDMIENLVNQAQIKILEAYVNKGEERIFRPLVKYEADIAVPDDYPTTEIVASNLIFQPRHCILTIGLKSGTTKIYTRQLSYLSPDKFFADNYLDRDYFRSVSPYPKIAHWTYENRWDLSNDVQYSSVKITQPYEDANWFVTNDALLHLTYVRYPLLFSVANGQDLELAPECHFEVAALAAELANTIDVLEYERGLALPPEAGARITLEKTGAFK